MIYQFLIHAENRSELHLGLVCNIVSTGLITTERDGNIGERCGVSPPVRCDLSWVMTFERNGDNRSNVPVVALRSPPANFSNRFAVMHTNYNYVHNITNLAIDSTRAHDLSMNPD